MTARPFVVQELTDSESWALLRTAPYGRLGYTEDALPMIRPLHFTVRDDEVVLLSLATVIRGASGGTVLAFEADDYDPVTHEGWCVSIIGSARAISARNEIAALDRLRFSPWVDDPERKYIAVRPGLLRGRRIAPAAAVPAGVLEHDGHGVLRSSV